MINNLVLIDETFTNGYRAGALDLLSLASILSGIFVIVSKNPIVSVLFLIGLFLFILMLINVRISELLSQTSNSLPLGLLVTVAFSYFVHQALPPAAQDIYS